MNERLTAAWNDGLDIWQKKKNLSKQKAFSYVYVVDL